MRRGRDFGDYAQGRVVDPSTFRATAPAEIVGGVVVGVFPATRDYVTVQTVDGREATIRVQQ